MKEAQWSHGIEKYFENNITFSHKHSIICSCNKNCIESRNYLFTVKEIHLQKLIKPNYRLLLLECINDYYSFSSIIKERNQILWCNTEKNMY